MQETNYNIDIHANRTNPVSYTHLDVYKRQLPYNVRFTERLDQLFGDKLVWLSKELVPYGSSSSYFGRDPSTTLVPALACFDGVTVEISNENF